MTATSKTMLENSTLLGATGRRRTRTQAHPCTGAPNKSYDDEKNETVEWVRGGETAFLHGSQGISLVLVVHGVAHLRQVDSRAK